MKIPKLLIISVLFLSSCGKDVDFGKFDLQKFKNDRGGCQGNRATMIEDYKEIKDKILGLSQTEVAQYFGRYDFQILDSRNTKIYVYYFEKGQHCQQIQNQSSAQSVALHFNAVGLVKEITFQRGNPLE